MNNKRRRCFVNEVSYVYRTQGLICYSDGWLADHVKGQTLSKYQRWPLGIFLRTLQLLQELLMRRKFTVGSFFFFPSTSDALMLQPKTNWLIIADVTPVDIFLYEAIDKLDIPSTSAWLWFYCEEQMSEKRFFFLHDCPWRNMSQWNS